MDENNNQLGEPVVNQLTPTSKKQRVNKRILLSLIVVGALVAILVTVIATRNETVEPEATAIVKISANGFEPKVVAVKKGTIVTWVNEDTKPHKIIAEPYPSGTSLPDLNSQQEILPGERYNFEFENVGEVNYLDYLNPTSIKGTVSVQ